MGHHMIVGTERDQIDPVAGQVKQQQHGQEGPQKDQRADVDPEQPGEVVRLP